MTADLAVVLADPAGTLLALDFDGTLAHIVDDPATAFGHAHAVDALARLSPLIGRVAIVTGRPVHQVLELGGFLDRPGFEHLVVCGQYGAERWDAVDGAPAPSHLVAPVERRPKARGVVAGTVSWLRAHLPLPDRDAPDRTRRTG